jgi:hypothetical protein
MVRPTEQGRETLKRAPPLLQESFSARFAQLADWEQTLLLASLQRVAALMDAERIDAAPVLTAGGVGDAPDAAGSAQPEAASSSGSDSDSSSTEAWARRP